MDFIFKELSCLLWAIPMGRFAEDSQMGLADQARGWGQGFSG